MSRIDFEKASERIGEVSHTSCGTPAKILEYVNNKNVLIEFQDEYKYQYRTSYLNFKHGYLTNPYECRNTGGIGFIGVGEYNSRDHKVPYAKWKQIISRCLKFNENDLAIQSYKDCMICDEWLNFQNFAKWYYENVYEFNGTLCVDKDILIHDNKLYSPNTCLIVPERINLLFIKEKGRRGELPIGVKKGYNCYTGMATLGYKKIHLGTFKNVEDAFYAYKNAKEKYIKQIADEYKDIIPQKLYNILYNYEVLITD